MDDAQKNRVMTAVVVFNIVLIAFQFFFNWGPDFSWLNLALGALVAGVAGGAAYGAMTALGK